MTTTTLHVTGLTRAERALDDAFIGEAIIIGATQATRADREAVRDARRVWARLRARVGYKEASARLLTSGASQHKLAKNLAPSFGLMLTPERGLMADALSDIRAAFGLDGAWNLCPRASKGCAAACLSRSGQSGMPAQQRAQAVRTAFLLSRPWEFGLILGAEIRVALRASSAINLRLNTTSDIRWEKIAGDAISFLTARGVSFYDYTAWHPAERVESDAYALTYSAKEPSHTPNAYLEQILGDGGNVAMPFDTRKGQPLPTSWHGFPVIDGDLSDERRNDPRGVVVGLRAKGHEWKRDASGFIRSAENESR